MDTNKAAQSFELEIRNELKTRVKSIRRDATLAHCILWLSIIASFASAIMVASGQEIFANNIWLAIIAGIPGLVVLLEKTFDFSRRSTSGTLYRIELQELKNDYDFGKVDAYKAAQRLQNIIRRHESAVSKAAFGGETNGFAQQPYIIEHALYRDNGREHTNGLPADKNHSGNGTLSNGNGVK